MTRRIRAPILVFSRGDAAIASDPLGAYWVLSQLALCSPYNALVGQLRTHAEKASGLPENNRKWFPDWDEQGREDLVTALLG